MSLMQVTFIVLTTIALSVGQVLFKIASSTFDLSAGHWVSSLLNAKLIVALMVYFFATIMWLLVLRVTPLRVAYPFAALAYFLVPVLAYFFLGEEIRWNTFVGAGLIGCGVWVSTFR